MQRVLIVLGLVILAAGVFWPWLSRLPFGRLPGDLVVDRPGFRLFAPFTTSRQRSASAGGMLFAGSVDSQWN